MTTKARGFGEGSVYRRQDGRWVASVSDGWGATGRKRVAAYGKTRQEAAGKLRALHQQIATGLPAPDTRTTLGKHLGAWLGAVAPGLRPKTMVSYSYFVRLIDADLGAVKLAKLTSEDVDGMMGRLTARGLSPKTVSCARIVLRAALSAAERKGLVAKNVARGKLVTPPTVPHHDPVQLSPGQVEAMLTAIPDPGLRRLVTVAVSTGLRSGELLGLRWSDVDSDGGELHVRVALQRVAGEYRLAEPKSAKSRRTVPLTHPAHAALQAERVAQAAARQAAGRGWHESLPGLVFTTATGQPRSGSGLGHGLSVALKAAGLPAMRWHDLRAVYGGALLASGADLGTVSVLLGHASVNLTLSTYAGVAPSLKHEAADRLEKLWATS